MGLKGTCQYMKKSQRPVPNFKKMQKYDYAFMKLLESKQDWGSSIAKMHIL